MLKRAFFIGSVPLGTFKGETDAVILEALAKHMGKESLAAWKGSYSYHEVDAYNVEPDGKTLTSLGNLK